MPIETSGLAGVGSAAGAAATEAFDVLGKLLSNAVAPLRRTLTEAADSADEVELSLSLGMNVGGNWVVASSTCSATISAKLLWKKKI